MRLFVLVLFFLDTFFYFQTEILVNNFYNLQTQVSFYYTFFVHFAFSLSSLSSVKWLYAFALNRTNYYIIFLPYSSSIKPITSLFLFLVVPSFLTPNLKYHAFFQHFLQCIQKYLLFLGLFTTLISLCFLKLF